MGWIILIDILLIIVIALIMSVEVDIKLDEHISIKVKYAHITLFSVSTDEKNQKSKKEKKKKDKKKKQDSKLTVAENTEQNSSDSSAEKSFKVEQEAEVKEVKEQPISQPKESVPASEKPEAPTKEKPSTVITDKTEKPQPSTSEIPPDNTEKKPSEDNKKAEKPSPMGDTLSEKWEFIKMLLESARKPVRRLISHIRITDVKILITASGEDAAEAAINYGKINIMINSLLALLYRFVRLKIKEVKIGVDFDAGETKYDIACKVKMRLSTAIGCALWLVGRIAIRYIKLINGNGEAKASPSQKQEGI